MTPEETKLTIPSLHGYEEVVVETVGTIARLKGIAFEKTNKLKTAVAEACVNAFEHGNKADATKQVVVTIRCEEATFSVGVRDFGEGNVDPNFEMPDLKKQIAEKKLGGWGMYLMHSLVDEVAVENAPDGGTITTLRIHS